MSLISSYAKRVCPHSLKPGAFPNFTSKRTVYSSTKQSLQRATTIIHSSGRNYLENKQENWAKRYEKLTLQQLKFDEDSFLPFIMSSEENTSLQGLVSTEEDMPDTKSAQAWKFYNAAYYIAKIAFIFFL